MISFLWCWISGWRVGRPAGRLTIEIALLVLLAIGRGSEAGNGRKSAPDIIRERGFDVEEHDVISQYVFVLKLYRIVNPLADPKTLHKTPIVASHGVMFNAASMMSASMMSRPRKPKLDERMTLYAIENGTDDRCLYFHLSNNNYDVWLIEARGSSERGARKLNDNRYNKSYWDFAIDEQALIDLPMQIEYVRKKTGAPKVGYISYSESTIFMFMLLSMEPDFGDKLASFVAVAPVFYTHHFKGMTVPVILARMLTTLSSASPALPLYGRKLWNFYMDYLCSISIFGNNVCKKIWERFGGPGKNMKLEGAMRDSMFKETSIKSIEQAIQWRTSKQPRMYDYKDEKRNLKEYGQIVPPVYNISNIRLRSIVFFRGVEDFLSNSQDQDLLINHLQVPLFEDHIIDNYSHMDFIVSETLARDVNEPILRALDVLTGRNVTRVTHTLGNPNPTVVGTSLVENVKPVDGQVQKQLQQQVPVNQTLPQDASVNLTQPQPQTQLPPQSPPNNPPSPSNLTQPQQPTNLTQPQQSSTK